MRLLLCTVALLGLLGLSGCASSGPDVREIEIHIGYSQDRKSQYLTPSEIIVQQGEAIRFVITNDDKPGASDAFHDVALKYPGYGTIEHEVRAGATVKTCTDVKADETTKCPEEKSYFIVSETGRFKMWCEVGDLRQQNADGTPKTRHEQMGMWGTLVVQ